MFDSKRTQDGEMTTNNALLMLHQAKSDQAPEQIGRLFELYRNYLNLLAEMQINQRARSRVDASDIVQETFLDAHRAFPEFRGNTEAEFTGWLRKILVRNILDQAKMQTAQKRDVKRVQSLEAAMDRSSEILGGALVAATSSPSLQLQNREKSVVIADAIAKLPEQQRQVILMRQVQQLQFPEIAKELGKSSAAIRMTWLRGLEKLRELIHDE